MGSARHPAALRALLPSICLLISATGQGQTWRSTLYPENWQRPGETVSFANDKLIQDFSFAGYKRGEEAIPNITGPVFNVTNYGADPSGASDSTVAIQSAINAAAAATGGVVYLPAGEFRISPQGSNGHCLKISSSNIVLRGAGTAQTFLLNTSHTMNGKDIIQVAPPSTSSGTLRTITADLPGPTRRIPVENAASFAPGDIVRLEWSFTDEWIIENNQQTWWNATNGRPSNARYLREVVTTNSTEGWIEIDVPTRYLMKTRDAASVRKISGLLTGVGIESLSIGNLQHPGTGWGENDYTDSTKAAYDTHGSWLISMTNVRDSWITDIHSRQAAANTSTCHMLSNGISLSNSLRLTVRNCEMRRPQYGGGGGNGYMYRIQQGNECLVENCIADFSRHGFVISHGGTSGNVFLQCEDRETQRATGSTGSYTTGGSGSDNHMHFSHSNLWDQCHAHNSFFTAHHRTTSGTVPHGVTSAHGVYWNTTGSGTRYNDIVRSEQLHYGYVIGTSGAKNGGTNPTGGNTAPADHLEGIGTGATLEPASLYLDQLSRRLTPRLILTGQSVRFPNNTFPVDAVLTLDGQSLNEPLTLNWTITSAPSGARHTSATTSMRCNFSVNLPGTYTIEASGNHAGQALSHAINVEVLPPAAVEEIIDLPPVADSHVQGGPHPSDGTDARTTNFGTSPILQIKNSGAVHVHREAFMRFDLAGIPAQSISDVALHLYFTSTDITATGRTSIVSDNTWDEMTINYLNRPTTQTALVGDWNVPALSWMIIDAGNVVPSQVDGNGLITFRQQITSQPSAPVYSIASRENANASFRPFLRVHLIPPTLDEWLADNSDLEPNERGPLDDPDGDGLKNLLEAWLGTNASGTDTGAMPRIIKDNDHIELQMQLNAAPPEGLVYFVEYSDTLAPDDWHLAPGVIWESTGSEANGRIPSVARVPDNPPASRRFYRINVLSNEAPAP